MNILNKNDYTKSLQSLGKSLPKPDAVLVISAHWVTDKTYVCSADKPEQLYDFYGFPSDLYDVKYHPPGARTIAESLMRELRTDSILADESWESTMPMGCACPYVSPCGYSGVGNEFR